MQAGLGGERGEGNAVVGGGGCNRCGGSGGRGNGGGGRGGLPGSPGGDSDFGDSLLVQLAFGPLLLGVLNLTKRASLLALDAGGLMVMAACMPQFGVRVTARTYAMMRPMLERRSTTWQDAVGNMFFAIFIMPIVALPLTMVSFVIELAIALGSAMACGAALALVAWLLGLASGGGDGWLRAFASSASALLGSGLKIARVACRAAVVLAASAALLAKLTGGGSSRGSASGGDGGGRSRQGRGARDEPMSAREAQRRATAAALDRAAVTPGGDVRQGDVVVVREGEGASKAHIVQYVGADGALDLKEVAHPPSHARGAPVVRYGVDASTVVRARPQEEGR